jgi:pimeloyl-ACP methyl ester carboxylesterase
MIDRRRLLLAGTWVASSTLARGREAIGSEFDNGYAAGDGARLFFVRAGEGPLMLFLHGHPDSGALYQTSMREFARDHLVVAPNLRGYAPSDVPEAVEAYAMPRLLGDIHGLIDHFGRDRCILIGNDWGGYMGWVFASAYPDRVQRLIILNAPHPAIFLREARANPAQIEASQYERGFDAAVPPYPAWYNYYRADPIRIPASAAASFAMQRPDLAASFFAGVRRPPATTSLRVSVPTLVIWGLGDTATLPGCLEGLEEYADDLTVVRMEEAGHYPMLSHPDAVAKAMREFVSRS